MKRSLFYRNRSCLSLSSRKQMIQSTFIPVIDYGVIVYLNAAATVLKLLDTVYRSFITGDRFSIHHSILYQKEGWPYLEVSQINALYSFCFIQPSCINLPYLTSLLIYRRTSYQTRSRGWLTLRSLLSQINLLLVCFFHLTCGIITNSDLVPLRQFRWLIEDLFSFTEECIQFSMILNLFCLS